jgi:hypothetical protein
MFLCKTNAYSLDQGNGSGLCVIFWRSKSLKAKGAIGDGRTARHGKITQAISPVQIWRERAGSVLYSLAAPKKNGTPQRPGLRSHVAT